MALSTKSVAGRSVLRDLRQAGSLKLVFPRPVGTALQGVIVNTAGGVTGGDNFETRVDVAAGTALGLTTQAAERAYRAMPGEIGRIRNRVSLGANARLDWLPQETILFQGSALDRRMEVDMACDARLLLCETLVFGRAAMGEELTDARLSERIEVRREGVPLFVDALRFDGNVSAQMARSCADAGAVASILLVAPDAECHLEALRDALPDTAGVSLIRAGTLFLRVLAVDSFVLRQTTLPILRRLSGADLPRPWMI